VALVSVATGGLTGVRRIDLYVDGVREQADYRPPFLYAWAASAAPAGSHTLSATLVRTNGTTLRSPLCTVRTTGE
jgi:hypothetical protein